MDTINIQATDKSPEIKSSHDEGLIEIKGRSHPENAVEFYKPLMKWIDDYVQNPSPKTVVNIELEHFNTSSSKCILDILKRLEILKKVQKEVLVNWYYEMDDEEMLEAAEIYRTMVDIPFELIETEGEDDDDWLQ